MITSHVHRCCWRRWVQTSLAAATLRAGNVASAAPPTLPSTVCSHSILSLPGLLFMLQHLPVMSIVSSCSFPTMHLWMSQTSWVALRWWWRLRGAGSGLLVRNCFTCAYVQKMSSDFGFYTCSVFCLVQRCCWPAPVPTSVWLTRTATPPCTWLAVMYVSTRGRHAPALVFGPVLWDLCLPVLLKGSQMRPQSYLLTQNFLTWVLLLPGEGRLCVADPREAVWHCAH